MDQLQQLMQVYDLAALRDYWSYLERRLFSRLEDIYRPTINKLKTSLFRFYLVYTIQVLVTAILLWLGRQSLDPQTDFTRDSSGGLHELWQGLGNCIGFTVFLYP